MSTILITGASGFIGKALALALSERHDVIGMSRSDPQLKNPWIKGEFASFEDLRQLDRHTIDAVVHLGAVTGGCSERDGLLVNVEGTRCLMRYLMDRGCRKFVMASSIAAVGLQSTKFRPLQLPIPDEHPCLDRNGYGLSKHLMEEVTKYYQRQNEELDVINLRLAAIFPDDKPWGPAGIRPIAEWCLAGVSCMPLSDAVQAFVLASQTPCKPGMRILNAVPPRIWATAPTAEILRNWWGKDVDLSRFEQTANLFAPVFDATRIRQELGFVAEHAAEILRTKQAGVVG